jgi:hypothetical protein
VAYAPSQECADTSETAAAGVVGLGLSRVLVDRGIGQRSGMSYAGVTKQGRQLGPVLVGGLGVGVPAGESFDEIRAL